MTQTRSLLWLSLVLLLVASVLMKPTLLVDRGGRSALPTGRMTPPGSSKSASIIEPGTTSPIGPPPTWTEAPQRLDLRGNEIARPVARYRVDERGSVYELHSPDTEVPRLKAPVM